MSEAFHLTRRWVLSVWLCGVIISHLWCTGQVADVCCWCFSSGQDSVIVIDVKGSESLASFGRKKKKKKQNAAQWVSHTSMQRHCLFLEGLEMPSWKLDFLPTRCSLVFWFFFLSILCLWDHTCTNRGLFSMSTLWSVVFFKCFFLCFYFLHLSMLPFSLFLSLAPFQGNYSKGFLKKTMSIIVLSWQCLLSELLLWRSLMSFLFLPVTYKPLFPSIQRTHSLQSGHLHAKRSTQ